MAQPGDVLAERWRLVEKIDAGAMGEIFRGAHAVLGHPVAVKVMMPDIARDPVAIERFLREARIAARLQHRNVVRVEDYGLATEGQPFIVMELLRGESLARRMSRDEPLPTRAVLEIVRQIAAALDAAHAAGIIHRDLKPENVFLVAEDESPLHVKVLDFGVAKFTDTLAAGGTATASNALIGTPRYMSPEQARSSRELDGRSDLWALGMLTYEMLAGRHPFEGEAIAEILVAILTHRIPPPTSLRPALPAALDVWTERALARNKHQRFASGREMFRALEQALADRVDEAWAPMYTEAGRARRNTPRKATVRVERRRTATDPTGMAGPAAALPESAVAAAVAPVTPEPAPRVSLAPPEPARPATSAEASGELGIEREVSAPPRVARAPWRFVVTAVVAAGLGAALTALLPSAPRSVRPAAPVPAASSATAPPRATGDRAVAAPPAPPPTPPSTMESLAVPPDAARGAEPQGRIRQRGRRDHRARSREGEYDPPGI